MRVVVNRMSALGRRTGVGHHAAQLVRALQRQAPADTLHAFPNRVISWVLNFAMRRRRVTNARPVRCPPVPPPGSAAPRWDRRLLGHYFRAYCRRHQFDLYHEPNHLPLPCDCPTITTVHDLSVLLHPDWHPADRVAAFEREFRAGVERSTHILTVSEFVRQEVLRVLGLGPERVTCVPNGVAPGLAPLPAAQVHATLRHLGLPQEYLLHVGTLEPRKNLLTLLRAYGRLPASVRERFPLLLVGGWGWRADEIADHLDAAGQGHGVRHLGYVADKHLAALYNGARALAFPSYYEGFGLPPLEMLACGGAVIASTAGAVVETLGTAAPLIDPRDEDGWREALFHVCTDDDWWLALRKNARAAGRRYTWQRCAADTLAVYRKVLGTQSAADLGNRQAA